MLPVTDPAERLGLSPQPADARPPPRAHAKPPARPLAQHPPRARRRGRAGPPLAACRGRPAPPGLRQTQPRARRTRPCRRPRASLKAEAEIGVDYVTLSSRRVVLPL